MNEEEYEVEEYASEEYEVEYSDRYHTVDENEEYAQLYNFL